MEAMSCRRAPPCPAPRILIVSYRLALSSSWLTSGASELLELPDLRIYVLTSRLYMQHVQCRVSATGPSLGDDIAGCGPGFILILDVLVCRRLMEKVKIRTGRRAEDGGMRAYVGGDVEMDREFLAGVLRTGAGLSIMQVSLFGRLLSVCVGDGWFAVQNQTWKFHVTGSQAHRLSAICLRCGSGVLLPRGDRL